MPARRVLVTGAHGFIGRHVARAMHEAGWSVTGIGHGQWAPEDARAFGIDEWHGTSITLDALHRHAGQPQAVIHCAGSGTVAYSMTQPHEDFRRSVDTTAAVLEFTRLRAPAAVVVLPSSAGVYGSVEQLPIVESAPLRPASAYGVHKLICEQLAASYAGHFSLNVALVRLFSVYGPGLRKQLLWDACVKQQRGDTTFFGTGDELRDWIHVEDAASLIERATHAADTSCPVFNGGTGQAATNRDLLGRLFSAFGRNDSPTFAGAGRPGDPTRYQASAARALSLGWAPRHHWHDGVDQYVAWYMKDAS